MNINNIQYYNLEQLRGKLSQLSFLAPVVIVSKSGAERWNLNEILSEQQNIGRLFWVSESNPNPTQQTIANVRYSIKNYPADGIIAIGGGSVIDIAKAVSAFFGMDSLDNTNQITRAIRNKDYLNNENAALPIIAVPSTAGTGSEVTQWATVWDMQSNSKFSVDAPWLEPIEAWIVPELTYSLPRKLMLATGLDAVCQASEAYWALTTNQISKSLSIRAIQMITQNLGPAISEPQNSRIRENLCTGSLLAGLAFSQTRTTACHSISYPLTSIFGIEHGLAAAITLAQIADINQKGCDLTDLLDVFAPYGGVQKWMDSVCDGIVTLRLSAFGITEHDLDLIVENAFTGGRMDNNPVDLRTEDVLNVLMNIYK